MLCAVKRSAILIGVSYTLEVPNEAEKINKAAREAIRAEMQRRNESVIALAKRMGVTRAYIYQVINGERAKVPDSLAKVLDALGLELIARPKDDDE